MKTQRIQNNSSIGPETRVCSIYAHADTASPFVWLLENQDGFPSFAQSAPGLQVRYPVSSGAFLDGIYQVKESNNVNALANY